MALLIMHTVGQPKVPHTHVGYDDIMARLDEFFAEKIALAERAGVARAAILLDPGIDFAKQCDDNLRIYRELDRLHRFERPILLPVSRKTVIGDVLDLPNAAERDAGTVACVVQGMLRGAQIFRVHNVRAAVQAVRTVAAVEGRPADLAEATTFTSKWPRASVEVVSTGRSRVAGPWVTWPAGSKVEPWQGQ